MRGPLLLALLVGLACLACVDAAAFSTRVNTSLQSLFTFTEGQTDVSSAFAIDKIASAPLGRLKVNAPPSSWDTNNVGVTFPQTQTANVHRVISEVNNTALLASWNSSGAFTFEMWFQPFYYQIGTNFMEGMIAGFGDLTPGETWIPECTDSRYVIRSMGGMRIIQTNANIYVEVVTRFNGVARCALLQGPAVLAPSHLVVTYNASQFETFVLYIDNVKMGSLSSGNSPYLPFWTTSAGLGTPFHLSPVYSATTGVATNFWVGSVFLSAFYNRSLTPAEITQNYNAWIGNSLPRPDGKTVSVPQNTRTVFGLNCSDFDVTNGRAPASSLVPIVMSLPSIGQLLYYNSTAGQFFAIPYLGYPISDSVPILAYVPVTNVLTVTSFLFKCNDGTADSKTNGTLTLAPFAVNQAPVALNSTQDAFAGKYSRIILTASDFEGGLISTAYVTSLPRNGTLFQTNSSLVPLQQILSVPTRVADPSLRLLYFVSASAAVSAQDLFLNDSFTFIVSDSQGLNSTGPGIQSISVRNNLQPSNPVISIPQNSNTTIQLTYTNNAATSDPLVFVLLSGPARGGSVYSLNGSVQYTSFPATLDSDSFLYIAPLNVFGLAYETFTYKVLYGPGSSNPGFASPIGTVTINLGFVAHAPKVVLKYPLATPFPVTESQNYDFRVSLSSFDPDTSVTVTLDTTGFGCVIGMTNSSSLSKLTFNIGNGALSPMISFKALRSDAAVALDALRVVVYVTGDRTVRVTVEENSFLVELQIPVTSTSADSSGTGGGSAAFAGVYIIVAWALIGGCCCCCCCIYCLRKCHDFKEHKHQMELEALEQERLLALQMPRHVCAHCAVKRWKAKAAHRIEIRTGELPTWAEADEHTCD